MIETTDSYRYLGIIFHKKREQNRRTWQYMCLGEHIVTKILDRVDAIKQLLDNLVLHIRTYGSEVWYPYTEQLEGDPIDQLLKASQDTNNHMRMPTLDSVGRS